MLEELCKRIQHCCATPRRSRNKRNVGRCSLKSLTRFKLRATACKRSVQTNATCNTQQWCVRLHGAMRSLLFIVEEFVRVVNMLFIIVTSAKVESCKLGTSLRASSPICSQANWAPEVSFGPFRALSSRQLTFPFCCFQLSQPNYIDRDDVIRTTIALHDFSFLFQVRILQLKKKGETKRLLFIFKWRHRKNCPSC